MSKKSQRLTLCAFVMTIVLGNATWGDLVGRWKLDETSGTVAADSSNNGLDGTLRNGGTWVAGHLGGAWQGDGADDYIDLGTPTALDLSGAGQATITAWVNPAVTKNHNAIVTKGEWRDAYSLLIKGDTSPPNLLWTGNDTSIWSAEPVPLNEWTHVAVTINGSLANFYINGMLNGPANQNRGGPIDNNPADHTEIGREDRSDDGSSARWYFNGMLDDVRLYNEALPVEQIQEIMLGRDSGLELATDPVPGDGQTDVPADTILSWTPGPHAASHDVYFGTSFADVNTASTAAPLGVLANAGQDANTYDPAGVLELGQTYYWRIDEVNAAPDFTVFKGEVWSFTVEPISYPLQNVTATASSFSENMEPQKTADGSGLNAEDQHSVDQEQMWLSADGGPQPTWIQYEFDRAYKLDQLLVWNYNQMLEPVLGVGARNVTVEYSADGAAWTALGDFEFAQAPGKATYTADITVDFGGAVARYVKLTIHSNWRGLLAQYGLSEVRFFYIPVMAREPMPASGQTDVEVDAVLSWRSGREAASHQVSFSADQQAVIDDTAPVQTVSLNRFDPGALNLGTTYRWKVTEVNDAETPAIWPGEVWSFSTREYLVIDDFESYNDEQGTNTRIYETWIDGYADQSSGSIVGNFDPPFAERTIIHGGRQSMPMDYNNVKPPFYSEAYREFAPVQDWTVSGADTLMLYLRGRPVGFLEDPAGHILMSGMGTDIYSTADQGRFVYKQLTGDGSIVARVDRLDNTHAWAKAGVMIRQSLDPSAVWAYVCWAGENGVRFQTRPTTAGAGASDTPVATPEQIAVRTPAWIKLERKGDQFNGYYATDGEGKVWTPMVWNPQTITMNAQVYLGLAVTSHVADVVTQAEFSNVAATGNVTGSWQSVSLTVEQPAGNLPDAFYVTVEDSSGGKAMVVNTDPLAVTAGAWTPWSIPLSDFAGVNAGKVKRLYIGVGDKATPAPGASGRIYIDDIAFGRPMPQ